jgi:hypothetical protein
MRERILAFVHALRGGGIEVSVAESLDAVRAVAMAGVEREVLRESLAAAVVKDEADRPAFDALFERAFPLAGRPPERTRRSRAAAGRGLGPGAGDAPARGRGGRSPDQPPQGGEGRRRATEPPDVSAVGRADRERDAPEDTDRARDAGRTGREGPRPGRLARARRLLDMPFADMTARDVAEARDLVRELGRRLRARLARRERRARRGRLDFRRTLRGAVGSGGVPARLRFRARRPGRPDLVALCDLSGSVAAASELLLGLLAPATAFFRRVDTFVYVDRLCPVSIEAGHVAPGGPLDLYARSDFGRVLEDLWSARAGLLGSGTLLLILGDARNNRLPPRADLLRAVRERVGRIVWLVPEPAARWNTGDSVLRRYAPLCDAVLECLDLEALVRAVRRLV